MAVVRDLAGHLGKVEADGEPCFGQAALIGQDRALRLDGFDRAVDRGWVGRRRAIRVF